MFNVDWPTCSGGNVMHRMNCVSACWADASARTGDTAPSNHADCGAASNVAWSLIRRKAPDTSTRRPAPAWVWRYATAEAGNRTVSRRINTVPPRGAGAASFKMGAPNSSLTASGPRRNNSLPAGIWVPGRTSAPDMPVQTKPKLRAGITRRLQPRDMSKTEWWMGAMFPIRNSTTLCHTGDENIRWEGGNLCKRR